MIIPQSRRQSYTARIAAYALAALCVLLLVFARQALVSASEALTLFSTRVLPALFPFYVLCSMLFRLGAFGRLQALCRGTFLPCFLTGAVAGNPNGARMCVLLHAEEYAAIVNLCSPAFLFSVVAVNLCGNAALFWPLAIAHYGSALLLWPVCRILFADASHTEAAAAAPKERARMADLFADVGSGMLAMLNIGGCIVFFYVLSSVLLPACIPDRFPVLSAMLVGLAEMTAGAARLAALSLPAPVQAGLLAFTVTFGGLAVFAQTMVVAPLRRPGVYLLQKGMQGCLAGILAYLLAPLFPASLAPAWSDGAETYAQNALVGLSFLLSAGVGLTATYLMALLLKRARAGRPGSHAVVNSLRPRPRRRPPR